MVSLELLPAASLAVTVMVLLPETKAIPATDQEVVPEAVPEVLLAELVQPTADTPILSEAVPDKEILELVAEQVALDVGEVMAMLGEVVS